MAITASEIRAVLSLQDALTPKLGAVMKAVEGVGRAAGSAGTAAKSAGSGWASMASAAADAGAKAAGVGPKIASSLSAVPNAVGSVVRGFGAIGLAAQGVQATIGAATSVGNSVFGLGALNEIEQVRASINAFTKDGAQTEQIIGQIKKEAASTPFAFNEMAKATASLMPVSKSSGVALMDLVKNAEILAASNPLEGLEGASFSLREAMTGDFTSIIERFNLSRTTINKLKAEGVPNLEIVRRAMAEMGFDSDLIAAKAETLDGRWSTFQDTLTELKTKMGQPIFDIMKEGLTGLQGYLDANMATFEGWADNVAGFIKTAIAAGKDLFDVFSGGDSFDGATEALSKIFPPAVVDFIVEGARQLGDAWRTVQQVFSGEWAASDGIDPFVNAVGSIAVVIRDQVIPAVTTFGSFVLEQIGTVVSWVQENMPLILATFSTVWNGLVTVVQAVWPVVQTVIGTAVTVILGTLKTLMQVITGDWSGAMDSLSGVASTAWEAVKSAFAAVLPALGSLIDAATGGWLTTITTWVSDTYTAITTWLSDTQQSIATGMLLVADEIETAWLKVKGFIPGLLGSIRDAIMAVWNLIPEDIRTDLVTIATHITTQGGVWMTNITTAGQNMLTAITGKLNEMVTAVTAWATQTFVQPLIDMVAPVGEKVTAVGGGMLTAITGKLGEIITELGTWVTNFLAPLTGLIATARSTAESVGNAIIEGIRGAINGAVESVANAAANVVRRALQAAKAAVGISGDEGVNVNVEGVDARAVGGPVSMGTPYIVGERGPELFVPMAGGTILPADATASLLDGSSGGSRSSEGGGRGGTNVTVVFQQPVYGLSDFESAVHRAVGRGLKQGRFG